MLSVADGCCPAGLGTEMRERTKARRFDFGDGVREVSIGNHSEDGFYA